MGLGLGVKEGVEISKDEKSSAFFSVSVLVSEKDYIQMLR